MEVAACRGTQTGGGDQLAQLRHALGRGTRHGHFDRTATALPERGDQRAEFAAGAGETVNQRMGQHRDATGGTYPARNLFQMRPDDGAGRGLALPEIPVEGLFGITYTPALDEESREVRAAWRGASGMQQCGVQRAGNTQPLEPGRELTGALVAPPVLRIHRRKDAGMARVEAQANDMALAVLVAGTELDAGQQSAAGCRLGLGREACPTVEGIVVGDGSEFHTVSGKQPEQVGRRQLAIGCVAVAMQVYAQPKKLMVGGIAG